ncbi:acyl-CoA synthetase [Pseudomaricurvus alkylphenolicus]|uniref:acyl-CoA synthetase n=1 Tax=Pseudomaricurvus alkylphenolicus TaxID=1306991 RepID=UPI0014249823|nr:acyl-CoA synthetase [Pseudomaricurvus alkylphenolicus]NIB42136.1 acyl-CoA synthetase [Pseudomaricurvus alkylphenolicus]
MNEIPFNIADMFERVADRIPQRTASICGDARITYAELDQRANQLAHHLLSIGVKTGDHVGVYLYNCNEFLETTLACFKIRAVPINVNYRYVAEELAYIIENSDMVACIHGREFIPELAGLKGVIGKLKHCIFVDDDTSEDPAIIDSQAYEEVLSAQPDRRDFSPRSEEDLFVLYTGGTTGAPKGVMWPHKALYFAALGGNSTLHPDGPIKTAAQIGERVDPNAEMVCAPLAPLMHGACWWAALSSLLAGRVIVLYPGRSFKASEIWPMLAQESVNIIALVGDAMAIPLLDEIRANPSKWDLSSLFVIGSGGAVFSKWVQQAFKEIFPNLIVTNSFGSSETGLQGGDNGKACDGLGRIARNEFADVVTAEGKFVTPGSGEQGYLARSGHIPVGYYNDAQKTASTFLNIDGRLWTLTGDLASVQEDGTIVVYGRGSNCINSGGEKIFPEEVEQAAKSHPCVLDALVVATPDPRFGSRVAAVVSVRPGTQLSLEELMEHCSQTIARYKLPRELHIADHICRSASGKPDYRWAQQFALQNPPIDGEAP